MPYTPTTWVEGVTTLGPTNMNKIETELAYLDARIPAAALAYGTTLPGSPVDGQEAILVDSTTNPTYQWRFRYNAGSSSAYKWEFVGGGIFQTQIDTSEATASGGFVDLTTVGPSFVLPRAGDYTALYGFLGSTSATPNGLAATLADNGVEVNSNYRAQTYPSAGSSFMATHAEQALLGRVAAHTVKLQYVALGGTATFMGRYLRLLPIRVS